MTQTHDALVAELRAFLSDGRKKLMKIQAPHRLGTTWRENLSLLLDTALGRIFDHAWNTARAQHGEPPLAHSEHESGLALIAIGGYGRGELCPHSDIDIAFLAAEEENPVIDAAVKEAFRLIVEVLIDGERLDVSYAYRPLADCERLDPKDKTSLLDARWLAGSEHLVRRLHEELHRSWDGVEYLLDKEKERREVALQPGMSLYGVEPQIKEGSGGLRDLQCALWVTSAMLGSIDPLRQLEWRGIVTGDDCARALDARDFFLDVRTWLHLATGRKTDVLRVEHQDACARWRGYTGTGAAPSQALLSEYYRHAEHAHAFAAKVFRHLLDGPLRLDDHFVATHRRVHSAHPYTIINHPELLVAPFAQARKYGFALDPGIDRAVEEALPRVDDKTRAAPIMRAGLWALLCQPHTAAEALTELREHGVLQALLPEFRDTLRLAPADPSHQLTVGEHSIMAVRQLGRMWEERHADGEMHDVWSGIDDVPLLVLGTLLHDVGKIVPGTDHAVSGEKLAKKIGSRLGLDAERNQLLGLLVRRHLLLPRAARLRDLSSPGTVKEIIRHVGDVPTLKMLYLLSIADTRAVGERTYSRLDLEAMRELYERALIAMTRSETAEVLSDQEKREQMVQRERGRVRRELRRFQWDDETLARLTDGLPASYVLNTPLPTIAAHLKFLDQLPDEKLIVDFTSDQAGGSEANFSEMTVVTYDDVEPGLLSKICGVVHAAGVEVLTAHVYTLRIAQAQSGGAQPDIVLDRLGLTFKGRALPESRRLKLAALLRSVIVDKHDVEEVIREAGKETGTRLVPERTGARNDLSDDHTVVSVVSENTSGLLYAITKALAEMDMDIHTAKITTWAGRAEDAFYITRRTDDGASAKLHDDEIRAVLEELRQRLIKGR
jgi:[protein-PII] uridylyltransferase